MHARYYDSFYSRFNRPDPGFDFNPLNPVSFNLYEYTWNNPVNAWDPDGEATYGFQFNIESGALFDGGFSLGIFVDDEGNLGIMGTESYGLKVGIGISGTMGLEITDAKNLTMLRGDSSKVGGSVTYVVAPGTVGGDIVFSIDPHTGELLYSGVSVSGGLGLGSPEVHLASERTNFAEMVLPNGEKVESQINVLETCDFVGRWYADKLFDIIYGE
jgi:hypothetical protein